MTFNPQPLIDAARHAAMDALERGVHAGCSYMEELLKASVSNGLPGQSISGSVSPFVYARKNKNGTVQLMTRPKPWQGGQKIRKRLSKRTGRGMDSIGYQIKERNDASGTITVLIGGDARGAETQGGFKTLPGYMTGHEMGIRVMGPGDKIRGPRTGPVVQRPWLRQTVSAYWGSFVQVTTDVMGQ